MPEHEGDKVLADKFIEFLINKIKTIRQNLDSKEKFIVPDYMPTYHFSEFSQITEEHLKKIIYSMQTKSYERDVIPTHFLKEHLDKFAVILTKLSINH